MSEEVIFHDVKSYSAGWKMGRKRCADCDGSGWRGRRSWKRAKKSPLGSGL